MLLKIEYNYCCWRVETQTMQPDLQQIIFELPKRLANIPEYFTLRYEDQEKEMIDVTCDSDLEIMFEDNYEKDEIKLFVFEAKEGTGFKKETISENDKESINKLILLSLFKLAPKMTDQGLEQTNKYIVTQQPQLHYDSKCNICQNSPIIGIRFKCLECLNFNLCQQCEQIIDHEHNLLKMKIPANLESKIILQKTNIEIQNEIQEVQSQILYKDHSLNASRDSLLIYDSEQYNQ